MSLLAALGAPAAKVQWEGESVARCQTAPVCWQIYLCMSRGRCCTMSLWLRRKVAGMCTCHHSQLLCTKSTTPACCHRSQGFPTCECRWLQRSVGRSVAARCGHQRSSRYPAAPSLRAASVVSRLRIIVSTIRGELQDVKPNSCSQKSVVLDPSDKATFRVLNHRDQRETRALDVNAQSDVRARCCQRP
jgi:hypothetical protein